MPKRSLTDLVLDTIDTISARKNRPNLVRIFRHLHRLYDLSFQTCESLLQTLLKEGKVIRVTYKGNISYRNALKWKKYSYYMKKNMGSELPGSLLTNAISELVVQEPDYLSMGVPCDILEQHLLSMQNDNINKEAIHKLLQRELKLESLLQLDNGNYFLGPKPVESNLYDNSDLDIKFESVKEVKVSKLTSPESCEKIISYREISDCYTSVKVWAQENNRQLEVDESPNVDRNVLEASSLNENKPQGASDSESEHIPASHESLPLKIEKSESSSINLNGIIKKLASHKLTELKPVSEENRQEIFCSNRASYASSHNRDSSKVSANEAAENAGMSRKDTPVTVETDVKLDNDLEPEGEVTNVETIEDYEVHTVQDVNKIIGVDSKELSETDGSPSPALFTHNKSSNKLKTLTPIIKSPSSVKAKVEDDEEEEEKDMKIVTPILERVRRKKKTKYDASDYYFPSLKRKTRDSSDTDRKEEKRKKKKKKKETRVKEPPASVTKRRVMFPGNTSMCCECNCYVSKVRLDPMIFCSTCSNQGHQSCAFKFMSGKNWFCVDCRQDVETCQICKKNAHEKERGELYACSCCSSLYHHGCHNPSIKLPFSTSWHCFSCPPVAAAVNRHEEEGSGEELSDGDECLSMETELERKKDSEPMNCRTDLNQAAYFKEEPPDPTNWSSKDVYNYFRKYFDEDIARAILEQDIDGYSLKLLGRADVLKLDFKLGICLKILLHIKRLQLHSNNLVDIWNN